MIARALLVAVFSGACLTWTVTAAHAQAAEKKLLWGDTHLHTSYSADAYLDGNFTVDPETAYRYARGEPVIHPYHHARVQINTPLDFLVVSDHAEFLGGIRQIHKYGIDTTGMGPLDKLVAWGAKLMFDVILSGSDGMSYFKSFSATPMDPREAAAELSTEKAPSIPGQPQIVANAWQESTRTADANNRPGEFTAFIGWEWTSAPGGANLHRVIVTDGDADSAAKFVPYSRDDSPYPEDLWHWLDKTSATTGDNYVAIPHNSNVSKGFMFPLETLRGEPFTPESLQLRRKWEPVVEATQTKGDSETYPSLSPGDDFADFERYTFYIQAYPTPYKSGEGDFVRSALKRGLQIEQEQGINPYQFGLIGSTDSHTGLSSAEEENYQGEQPAGAMPKNNTADIGDEGSPTGWDMSASGRAAVWAEDNTRAAILQAFARREVYATTGPRIAVRFDGSWFPGMGPPATPARGTELLVAPEWPATQVNDPLASTSVPMGANLPTRPSATHRPGFVISAMKDPEGANLDRIQVIKGWVDALGESHERIYNVAWSGARVLDQDGNLPDVGNTVDSATASYSNSIGAPTLQATWQDPQFNPSEPAFYYVRVLEIPTPRHSLYDMVALGEQADARWPGSLQERAYTSPIWYQPHMQH
ncbi:MAG: DUF3604 domain-containing protein [Haliea sp.]|nr:DUF3604 domain-containing protein [Haliea sp.]